jgi:hypothetical protein
MHGLQTTKQEVKMTLEALEAERNALMDFREWLEEKLFAVELDLSVNQIEAEELLNDMEAKLK